MDVKQSSSHLLRISHQNLNKITYDMAQVIFCEQPSRKRKIAEDDPIDPTGLISRQNRTMLRPSTKSWCVEREAYYFSQ
jgi:hypothetical protein